MLMAEEERVTLLALRVNSDVWLPFIKNILALINTAAYTWHQTFGEIIPTSPS